MITVIETLLTAMCIDECVRSYVTNLQRKIASYVIVPSRYGDDGYSSSVVSLG